MEKLYAVVDLGATNIRVACGDERGLKKRLTEATDMGRGAEGIAAQIVRMIDSLEIEDLTAIGIGSIGPLNLEQGCIVNTPNLPYKMIPIVEPLTNAFRVPIQLQNDCTAGVLGEHAYGAGRGLENIVYVTLSTGLGGGAIVDGHLLVGKDGNAHEIGHLTIDPGSELLCGCGCKGHWEAYSSGANIPNYARLLLRGRKVERSRDHAWCDLENISTESIFREASRGDPVALWIMEKIGDVNAIGFADIVNVYDPELITVGGSVALNNPDLILRPIEERIDRHLINRRPEIKITPLRDDIVLYGALTLVARSEYQAFDR